MKLKSAVDIPIIVTSVLAAALVAVGVLLSVPSGEQSKMEYNGNLWCVSNFIEKKPTELISDVDKRPKEDPLLTGKEAWIVRDQVSADTAAEAEAKSQKNGNGLFEPSDKTALRAALTSNDENFFTTHFNQGATYPGPCWGTGWSSALTGSWLSDRINQRCGLGNSCDVQNSSIDLINRGTVSLPASGKIVEEDHLVTAEENFQPKSVTDGIDKHLSVTSSSEKGFSSTDKKWTPAESGGNVGRGSGSPPPAKYEPWIMNMYWKNAPAEGTRVIIKSSATGKSVVAIAGYETGPRSSNWLLGAQSEVLMALGISSDDTVEVGIAKDQTLEPGPITCQSKAKVAAAAVSSAGTKTIAIDPGHGTLANSRDKEGPTELSIGLKLKTKLEALGFKVVMTRTTDGATIGGVTSGEYQDNIARVNIANAAKADLTIRLHSDDRSDNNFWTIYPNKRGTDKTGNTGPDNSVIANSKILSQDLTDVLKNNGFTGITKGELDYRDDALVFSTRANAPVATIEVYGHDSADLYKKYQQDNERDKVATALTAGVVKYEGGLVAKPVTTTTLAKPNNCPTAALKSGPAEGKDMMAEIAHQIETELSERTSSAGGIGTNTGSLSNFQELQNLYNTVSNPIAKTAIGEYLKGVIYNQDSGNPYAPDGAKWCAYFVSWVVQKAGNSLPTIGSVNELFNWFKTNNKTVFQDPAQAQAGDIVAWHGHTGIIVANDQANKTITTVEGNTSHTNGTDRVNSHEFSYEGITSGLQGFARW